MDKLDGELCLVDAVPASGYLWCLHCSRAYKKGEYRLKPSQWSAEDAVVFREEKIEQDTIEMMLAPIEMCPYDGCDGDVIGYGLPWEFIREAHPEYPEVPEIGCRYSWS